MARFAIRRPLVAALAVLGALAIPLTMRSQAPQSLSFDVRLPAGQGGDPVDGRLLLLLSRDDRREPRFQIADGVATQQVFGVEVDGLRSGQSARFDASSSWMRRARLSGESGAVESAEISPPFFFCFCLSPFGGLGVVAGGCARGMGSGDAGPHGCSFFGGQQATSVSSSMAGKADAIVACSAAAAWSCA